MASSPKPSCVSSRFPDVQIRLYATLRPIVGAKTLEVTLGDDPTVRDLVEHLITRWPELRPILLEADGALSRRCNVLIDGRSARHLPEGIETRIAAADEVDVFPAIAGG